LNTIIVKLFELFAFRTSVYRPICWDHISIDIVLYIEPNKSVYIWLSVTLLVSLNMGFRTLTPTTQYSWTL